MSGVTLKVTSSKSKLPKIKAALQAHEVVAGILRTAGKHSSGENVAQIAAYNEFGTPKIPERPAFRASFHTNRAKYQKELAKIAKSGLNGNRITPMDFNHLGREAVNDIERSIVAGSWTPNAESTQLKKGRGKQLINDPWIDTGQTLNSVDFRVDKS